MSLPDRILLGVALMITFCVIAPLIDVSAKLAAQGVSVGVITLGRFIVQSALMLPIVLLMRLPVAMDALSLRLTVLRALCGILSTFAFVAAIKVMPIADALAIVFVEPFIILLIGKLAMNEQVGARRLGACAVGFLGSLLVIQPSFAKFGFVALWPLACALFFALYMLITRALSRRSHPVAMQLTTALTAVPLCLPFLLLGWALGEPSLEVALPQGIFWLWLFGVGLAASINGSS